MKSANNVTIKDIATATGVSIATVSRVLNGIPGKYSADTEASVKEAARKLGYAPNVMARSLVTKRTNLVAVLIPDIHYYFFQEFYSGLENYFNLHGYRLLLCNTEEDSEKEKQFLSELSNGLVDGIIVSTLNKKEDNSHILDLVEKKFPIVTLERYGDELKKTCNVRLDNRLSAALAVDYLAKCGHEKIAFLRGPKESVNSEERYKGYQEALKRRGFIFDPNLVKEGNYQFKCSAKATEELLEEKDFTAIISSNDLMASGAIKAIMKAGKRIPDDISMITLDSSMLTEFSNPSMTAVDFCGAKMGECAGECLKKLINGEELETMEYNFIPVLKLGKSVSVIESR